MRKLSVLFALLIASFAISASGPASAQSASPRQIQALIAQGQEQSALAELQPILQAHPDSGVAWYLARSALANAEHDAPGLPFARPDEVTALQAHLAGAPAAAGGGLPLQAHSGISPALVGIIGLVILFLVLRMLFRPRRFLAPGYPGGYGPPGPASGPYPYGPGPGGFGPAGLGSGLGGSILGGLAAGAGFAAGERVIDDVFGHNNDPLGGNFQQDPNFGNGVPDRDDGLQGNPGWDDGSGNQNDNFDPGNNW
jgi:hypothetical protein